MMFVFSGVSANADPHTNKLRTRVTHIWGYRRRQLNRSAMEEPLPGETAWMITVFPVPGKYAVDCLNGPFEWLVFYKEMVTRLSIGDGLPLNCETSICQLNFEYY